ncbi:hypothetical protein [Xanthocytophaga flava]|uniref:hypothetical protein n=1 Tax=Xanthocytophaga flava TaxID=3048013 RepID=UPI0028D60C74|nr:hypothetical protein [Xanthocytophaga flavus]MDJ1472453.1 hypothetical protein [Xanthocytophaga flavus]
MDRQNNNGVAKYPVGIAPFKITGDWYLQAKALQQRFPQLTDADLRFQTGKVEELLCRIVTRLDQTREEVIECIKIIQSGIPIRH